jgi:hypothetical protein
MTFLDLPDDWSQRPLTDPWLVAGVLDLVVSDDDRVAGGLAVLMCDEQARLLQPGIISDLDHETSEEERSTVLTSFVAMMSHVADSVIFALVRADGLSITPDDEVWARAARLACGDRVRLLGFHVVTRDGSRQLPGTIAAA